MQKIRVSLAGAVLCFFHCIEPSPSFAKPSKTGAAQGEAEVDGKSHEQGAEPYSLGVGYSSLNISNSSGLSDVISGDSGRGLYLAGLYELTPSHVFEIDIGQYKNTEDSEVGIAAISTQLQWNYFWTDTVYQTLGLAYQSTHVRLLLPALRGSSYDTQKLLLYAGIGQRWTLWKLSLAIEYASFAYSLSTLSESYSIADPGSKRLYAADERQSNGNLLLYRALNFQLTYDF